MMFLYFVVEVVIAYFAINQYDIKEDINQCNCESDLPKTHTLVQKKRNISIILFAILLLISSFQSIDFFRMCSPKSGFKSILNQNIDHVFPGLLCFVNIAVSIICIVMIFKVTIDNSQHKLHLLLIERLEKVNILNSALANLVKKYGEVSDIIRISSDDTVLNNAIIRFDSSQNLFCLGRILSYSEIEKCHVFSTPIHKTTTKTVTRTSTGSALGRAVVGGVIAGPVGSIIGGTTGKKNSETITEDTIERWEHKVWITLTNEETIIIPINPLSGFYEKNNDNKILTMDYIVKRIETLINGAVDVHNGLMSNKSINTKPYEIRGKETSYICTMCGFVHKTSAQPSNCQICGNTTFKNG